MPKHKHNMARTNEVEYILLAEKNTACNRCARKINKAEPVGLGNGRYCMYCTEEILQEDLLNNRALLKTLKRLYKKQLKVIAANRLAE